MIDLFRIETLMEARWIFAALFALLVILWMLRYRIGAFPALLGVGLILFTLWFFRDPERTIPNDPMAVLAASDGLVTDIVEIEENTVLKKKMKRVGIFLSVFDVHVNRAPIAGTVTFSEEFSGAYLDARDPEASGKNACHTWAFRNAQTTVVVRQLTGLIARRLVPWSQKGDVVEAGHRFGMIRFGSRTEVYVPLNAEITVEVGQKVVGGVTEIARLQARSSLLNR